MTIGTGISTQKEVTLAAREAVQQAFMSLGKNKANLALVFGTTDLSYHSSFLKTVSTYLGATPVIGCSSAAVFSNQGITKQGVAVMLLSFPEGVYFNVGCTKNVATQPKLNTGFALGEKLLYGFQNSPRDFGVIFFVGSLEHGTSLVNGLQERFGYSFPLIGAFAPDNPYFAKTFLYYGQETLIDAASGFLMGGKVRFGWGIKHGWQPLGKPQAVTKSKGNIVYEINGVPAVSFYKDYFGFDTQKLRKELKRISTFYPIGIHLKSEEEFLLRNLVAIEEDGSIIFQGDVPEKSQIRLMIGTKESCLRATKQALEEALNRIGNHPIDFVLVFDSLSRYMLLGREAHKELDLIKAGLPPKTPIIGLYTHEELAPLLSINFLGKTYVHNQAIALLAVGSESE